MGASTVTGKGLGVAPQRGPYKTEPVSNVEHVLFASPANDGETIGDKITVIFLKLNEDDFSLVMPNAKEHVGRTIIVRSRNGGNTVTFSDVYGGDWNYSTSYTTFTLLCDGSTWTVASWYNDD